jgi:hypothetical protein
MRERVDCVLACIAVVLLAARAMGAAPAPTTASTSPDLQPLIRMLSSDQFKDRQEAREKLTAIGDDAADALTRVLKTTTDPEVRTSIESVLAGIADSRKSGPTRLTLHMANVNPQQVLDAIAKQAGADIRVWPDGLWRRQAAAGISIDADRALFWDVMKEFCQKAKVAPRSMGMGGDLTLMQVNEDAMAGASSASGAFLVVASGASAFQSVTYTKPEKFQSSTAINMVLYVEPKIRVVSFTGPEIEIALDDAGKSWKPSAPAQPMIQQMFRRNVAMGMGIGRSEHVLSASIQLLRPAADCGKRLVKLKGQFRVSVTDTERVEFDNAMNIKNVSKTVAGREVVFKDITGEGEQLSAVLAIKGGNDPRVLAAAMRDELMSGAVKLLDADGHAWQQLGSGSPRPNQDGEIELHFQFMRHGPGGAAGDPAKLVWDVAGTPHDITIPFEFTDLALPKSPGEAP